MNSRFKMKAVQSMTPSVHTVNTYSPAYIIRIPPELVAAFYLALTQPASGISPKVYVVCTFPHRGPAEL
jgi:hypothetical protein